MVIALVCVLQCVDVASTAGSRLNSQLDRREFQIEQNDIDEQASDAPIEIFEWMNPKKPMMCPGKQVNQRIEENLIVDRRKVTESFGEVTAKIKHERLDAIV